MVLVETLVDTLVKKLAGTVKFPIQGIKWGSGTLLYVVKFEKARREGRANAHDREQNKKWFPRVK